MMPTTMRQTQESLHKPALCELLPVREYLDGVAGPGGREPRRGLRA